MAAFVLDCSVAMSWLFKDEVTPATTAILNRLENESAIVPSLWFLEVANVLTFAERKGRIDSEQSEDFLDQLRQLPLQIEAADSNRACDLVLPLSRLHGLTAYDALYLDLAMRTDLPLATLDDPLRKAAKKAGVSLLGK